MKAFEEQLGGHHVVSENNVFLVSGATVLKPIKKKDGGDAELKWYEEINKKKSPLLAFIPHFHGKEEYNGKDYIKLENLLSTFKFPCIVDFKIGKYTYPPEAAKEKVDYELSKYAEQEKVGFRLTGMRVYQYKNDKYMVLDKHFGRDVKTDNLKCLIENFYSSDLDTLPLIHEKILTQLAALVAYFKVQTEYHFTASSVFIIYEGDPLVKDPSVSLKLIDFFYARGGEGSIDESTSYGLTQLLCLFNLYKPNK